MDLVKALGPRQCLETMSPSHFSISRNTEAIAFLRIWTEGAATFRHGSRLRFL